jgi:hypothetical protein
MDRHPSVFLCLVYSILLKRPGTGIFGFVPEFGPWRGIAGFFFVLEKVTAVSCIVIVLIKHL